MKGLRKYLTPFAPDQSGAVSVLYELGGMIVICDAGGCAGNICGFDEPRWFGQKSAIFSAGLRDMDAIMGRDDRLAAKIADAAGKIEAAFIAVIGTPVPAVIGTDYRALCRLIEKETGICTLAVDTNGMELYDKGAEKALAAVYDAFAKEFFPVVPGRFHLLGASPDDLGKVCPKITLDEIRTASAAEKNLVCAPAGMKTARLLHKRFGTPYEIGWPQAAALLPDLDYTDKEILVVHQHVFADTLRKELLARGARSVTVGTWFGMVKEIEREGDRTLREEDEFEALIRDGGFDMVVADAVMQPMAKDFAGCWIDAPHFAVSGRYE